MHMSGTLSPILYHPPVGSLRTERYPVTFLSVLFRGRGKGRQKLTFPNQENKLFSFDASPGAGQLTGRFNR